MRVRLIHKADPHTGKGKFAARLAQALRRQGVDVVGEQNTPADIDLQFGKWNYEPRNCARTVLRLGPAHIDRNQNIRKLNKPKWRAAKRADGIIYQSRWSRRVCHKFLGRPRGREAVIFNGDAGPVTAGRLAGPHVVWVAAARKWLPQKRLRDVIAGFNLGRAHGEDLVVYGQVLGERPFPPCSWLKYGGLVSDSTLSLSMSCAAGLIHMVYLDACPNVVVEALRAGCPVLCGDQGGTHELVDAVGCYGAVLADREWNGKALDLSKPPRMSPESIARGMAAIRLLRTECDVLALDIDTIATQYHMFFLELLQDG